MTPASKPQRWAETAGEDWTNLQDERSPLAMALHRLKRLPEAAYGCLCEPFESTEFGPLAATASILVEWRFFNPFGPSRNALLDVPVPGSGERLLIQRSPAPQVSSTRVWGWLPSQDPKQMRPILMSLFRANGCNSLPLMHTLPTHIELEGPFSNDDLREFFWAAAQATGTCGLRRTCDYLEWFKENPFERAAAEFRDALDGRKSVGPATRADFDRWWDLVTDAQHIAVENLAIQEALRAQPGELANFLREALRSRPEVF